MVIPFNSPTNPVMFFGNWMHINYPIPYPPQRYQYRNFWKGGMAWVFVIFCSNLHDFVAMDLKFLLTKFQICCICSFGEIQFFPHYRTFFGPPWPFPPRGDINITHSFFFWNLNNFGSFCAISTKLCGTHQSETNMHMLSNYLTQSYGLWIYFSVC